MLDKHFKKKTKQSSKSSNFSYYGFRFLEASRNCFKFDMYLDPYLKTSFTFNNARLVAVR